MSQPTTPNFTTPDYETSGWNLAVYQNFFWIREHFAQAFTSPGSMPIKWYAAAGLPAAANWPACIALEGAGTPVVKMCDGQRWNATKVRPMDEHVKIVDRKASGTNGGTFTAGGSVVRTLNVVEADPYSFATLTANVVRLPVGLWLARLEAPAYGVGKHAAQLIVEGVPSNLSYVGTEAYSSVPSGAPTDAVASVSVVECVFQMNEWVSGQAGGQIYVRHLCETTRTSDGFGQAAGGGSFEYYTTLRLWRLR